MKIIGKELICTCIMALGLMLSGTTGTVYAEDASVLYEANAHEYVFSPGSDESPTDLFPNFKSVMPGDTLTQSIVVKNDSTKKVKARVYLRSLGGIEENEFLSQMNLEVVQVTDTELFDAPADQTAGLTDWTLLGTLMPGAEVNLNVNLQVPITMDNRFQEKVGKILWQFKVEEIPYSTGGGGVGGSSSSGGGGSSSGGPGAAEISDSDTPLATILPFDIPLALPQTGTLWWLVPILAIAGIVMFVGGTVKNRRKDEEE